MKLLTFLLLSAVANAADPPPMTNTTWALAFSNRTDGWSGPSSVYEISADGKRILRSVPILSGPPPLPITPRLSGVVDTNNLCPPATFIFTNLVGKTGLETSTNLTSWKRILTWPTNEYRKLVLEVDQPTNRQFYWRLVP